MRRRSRAQLRPRSAACSGERRLTAARDAAHHGVPPCPATDQDSMTTLNAGEEAASLRAMAGAPVFMNLHELVARARQNLNQNDWDYIVGGTESETTLRRNRQALDSIAFRPRVLRDVSTIDASVTGLGRRLRLPVVLAPVGSVETFEPGGGATAAKASAEFEVPQMLSSV